MTEPGYGWCEIQAAAVRDLMKAPSDAQIVGAEFKYPGVIRLLFASADLPPVTGLIPTIQPVIDNSGWNWNVPPLPEHRYACSWKGTFPPPSEEEIGVPDFSLEDWSSDKATAWLAALMANPTVESPTVGVTPGGDASTSGVVTAPSAEAASAMASEAFSAALDEVTFDGDVKVHDLEPDPDKTKRSDALVAFDDHLRTHGCGDPKRGGFARCPVATALWRSIPPYEQAAVNR